MTRDYFPKANRITVWAVLVFLTACHKSGPLGLFALAIPSSTPDPLPSNFFLHASAQRQHEGEIVISGDTNLPDGLRIGVEIDVQKLPPDQDSEILVDHGQFRSRGFTGRKPTYPPGRYRVHFFAHFNTAWQKPPLLRLIGDGGTRLKPGRLFKLEDPEVIDSDRILDLWQTIAFPPLSNELQAISLVKSAVLTTPKRGRSADNVENTIKEFMDPPDVHPARGWSATKIQNQEYRVFFDFIDGSLGEKQAIWSANLATRQVRYLNKSAKILSWLPNHHINKSTKIVGWLPNL